MTKTVILTLMLAAFALPAHAGQWVIEETDDNYIVEYKGDPADKPAPGQPANRSSSPQEVPAAGATQAPPAARPVESLKPAGERPARIRDQGRRERAPRPPRDEE